MNKLRAEYRWRGKNRTGIKLLLFEIITIKHSDNTIAAFLLVLRIYFTSSSRFFSSRGELRSLKYHVKTLHGMQIESQCCWKVIRRYNFTFSIFLPIIEYSLVIKLFNADLSCYIGSILLRRFAFVARLNRYATSPLRDVILHYGRETRSRIERTIYT